jgi:hypothetical protein
MIISREVKCENATNTLEGWNVLTRKRANALFWWGGLERVNAQTCKRILTIIHRQVSSYFKSLSEDL